MTPTDSTVAILSFLETPAFLELFHENYSDEEDLILLHEGKVHLPPIGIESIENFN